MKKDFETPYQELIYKRTYARWLEDKKRRENWDETVKRYKDFFSPKIPSEKKLEFHKAIDAIKRFEILPSMRALWTAGQAAEKEGLCIYNCSARVIDTPSAFSEVLYILMNGTGVGYSVERQYVNQLPDVPEEVLPCEGTIIVQDSKKGWAIALKALIANLYSGKIPSIDYSKLRPKGARLKTFGGRSSGPEALKSLFDFIIVIFQNSTGRKLQSIECHDICCKIAEIVCCGGCRRSACISFSNLSDQRMAKAKSGQFWLQYPYRAMANNSVAYTEKPDAETFCQEWLNLIQSKSGERGIFNRQGAMRTASMSGRRDGKKVIMSNPCAETLLRNMGLCNLTSVVLRSQDTKEDICKKVRQATILGIAQSLITNFKFVSREWKKNQEEERLLGVSLSGLRDHPILCRSTKEAKALLTEMKQVAIDTAEEWSNALGINMPTAITVVKPEGTSSQMTGTASGLHARFAPYYIRRIRITATDPLCEMLRDIGVPNSPEIGQTEGDINTYVFEFPIKSPDSSVMADEISVIEQLNYWLMLKQHWCEQSASVTVYVSDHEWMEAGAWVYKHWDQITGITFLPRDDSVYQLAPYEAISEEEYDKRVLAMPEIDYGMLSEYERQDETVGAREFACTGGACEVN